MGRIIWPKEVEVSGQMSEQGKSRGSRLKAKDKLRGTDIIVFSDWCHKCAFEKLAPNVGPCAFCKNRPQITPTHYRRKV